MTGRMHGSLESQASLGGGGRLNAKNASFFFFENNIIDSRLVMITLGDIISRKWDINIPLRVIEKLFRLGEKE